jgi:putative transposase
LSNAQGGSVSQLAGGAPVPDVPAWTGLTGYHQRLQHRGARTRVTSAHDSIHNHFNHNRYLNRRAIFKDRRSAALAEWRELAA